MPTEKKCMDFSPYGLTDLDISCVPHTNLCADSLLLRIRAVVTEALLAESQLKQLTKDTDL